MALVLVYHGDFKLHDPYPYDHPESPVRLELALHGLESHGILDSAERVEPGRLSYRSIYRVAHEKGYIEWVASEVEAAAREGMVRWLDPDTYVSPGTRAALARLAGAVEAVASGGGGVWLVLPRPPGHHAGRAGRAMGAPTLGFCILNTSAAVALLLHGAGERVAVVDFDLHHGNGTQEILYDKPILHVDIHQDYRTIYPGTGAPGQTGEGEGAGTKVNINIPPGSGDDVMLDAAEKAMRFLEEWKPTALVVSAGFDAYRGDNYMGSVSATSRFYHAMGERLASLATRRVVIVLEGGYSAGLERGLPAFIAGLLGEPDPIRDEPTTSSDYAWRRYRLNVAQMEEALERASA